MKEIFDLLINVKISDILDIFFVTILIYRLLVIVQGTRTIQMIMGIGGLGVLFALSLRYKLYSLSWILDKFFENSFIIMLILFQDSIKTALMTIGGTKLFFKSNKMTDLQVIEEVIDAATALSREKIGALIVFERYNGLLNFANTGTRLDCKIHSDILYTIFQNNSPLHDGAVIVFNNKIQAAGCFLPLSKNVELDRHLGTRHRASLGISEITDAVVLLVSEETGEIKICYQGQFYLTNSEEELRKILRKYLINDLSLNKVGLQRAT